MKTGTQLIFNDSLKFDFSKIGKVDIIFTSPPFFSERMGTNFNFGKDHLSHVKFLSEFIKKLHKDLKAAVSICHLAKCSFLFLDGNRETIRNIPSTTEVEEGSGWSHISEGDIYSIFSKYLGRFIIKARKEKVILLDPYCGTCTIIKVAASYGMHCYGVDISSQELGVAKKKLGLL